MSGVNGVDKEGLPQGTTGAGGDNWGGRTSGAGGDSWGGRKSGRKDAGRQPQEAGEEGRQGAADDRDRGRSSGGDHRY